MRYLSPWTVVCVTLLFAGCASAPAPDGESGGTLALRASLGEWTYRLLRTQPGTRSEGRQGQLLQGGESVEGEPGVVRETPLGSFRYTRHPWQVENLWEESGWLPAGEFAPGATVERFPTGRETQAVPDRSRLRRDLRDLDAEIDRELIKPGR